jgi:ComF family protein
VTIHLPLYQETRAKLLSEGGVSDLVSCFIFEKDGPFQHIAHALKYKEYKSIGLDLGMRIGEILKELDLEVDLLIPIPLHHIKYRERGYNQSEFIAHGISSVIDKPIISKAVRRIRYTQSQTKLSIEERHKNMERAFELIPHSCNILSGKRCLLVDDVITTGATTNSCAQVILSAGVTKIIAASAALAQ